MLKIFLQFFSDQHAFAFIENKKNKKSMIFIFNNISKYTYRERAGEISSTITFLKSVGSTDQNALYSALFV